jgi:hypothetical protein
VLVPPSETNDEIGTHLKQRVVTIHVFVRYTASLRAQLAQAQKSRVTAEKKAAEEAASRVTAEQKAAEEAAARVEADKARVEAEKARVAAEKKAAEAVLARSTVEMQGATNNGHIFESTCDAGCTWYEQC